ncbi:MAG: tyrosine-type recombinase/integrase [Legionella sp.]|uniref:tyrosine-type recombinase/integrase n=1 Tax=Legionella sp. TaxID=459 RepID=UPI00283BDBFC|nr:tyrosine-type recombinase/integrase [Legionella sp.]
MAALNHPQKGDIIKVDPIRTEKDIKLIKRLLADRPRDYCLFVMGINTNLRASDLLKMKITNVKDLQVGDQFNLVEKKTSKGRCITMNKNVHDAIQNLLISVPDATDKDYLFQSRKGKKALSVPYFNSLVKSWCKDINLKGNFGSHTLRKTFGYIHRTVFNTDLPTLMTLFNHSTQKQTLSYLGVQASEVKDAYLKEI